MDEYQKTIRLNIVKIGSMEVLTELIQYNTIEVADKTCFDLTTEDLECLRGIV